MQLVSYEEYYNSDEVAVVVVYYMIKRNLCLECDLIVYYTIHYSEIIALLINNYLPG